MVIVDRINKEYLNESMENIKKDLPFDFDFYSFQALLSNQLYIAGKDKMNVEDYSSLQIEEDAYSVYIKNTDKYNTEYSFTSDYTHRILSSRIYKKEWNSGISCRYENFGLTNNKRLFPMNIKLEMKFPDDVMLTELTFKQIDIDTRFEINADFPAKYQRVSLENIIKTMGLP
jgi:hypothetical protein